MLGFLGFNTSVLGFLAIPGAFQESQQFSAFRFALPLLAQQLRLMLKNRTLPTQVFWCMPVWHIALFCFFFPNWRSWRVAMGKKVSFLRLECLEFGYQAVQPRTISNDLWRDPKTEESSQVTLQQWKERAWVCFFFLSLFFLWNSGILFFQSSPPMLWSIDSLGEQHV